MTLELPAGTIVISRSSPLFSRYASQDIVMHNEKLYQVKADIEIGPDGVNRLRNLYLYLIQDTPQTSNRTESKRSTEIVANRTRDEINYDSLGRIRQRIQERETVMARQNESPHNYPRIQEREPVVARRCESTNSLNPVPRLRARVVGSGYIMTPVQPTQDMEYLCLPPPALSLQGLFSPPRSPQAIQPRVEIRVRSDPVPAMAFGLGIPMRIDRQW